MKIPIIQGFNDEVVTYFNTSTLNLPCENEIFQLYSNQNPSSSLKS